MSEATESTESAEIQQGEDNTPETVETGGESDSKTFSADYVSELRNEAKGHRTEAKKLATRLHAELVRSTGRLADPNDLAFDPSHLEDSDALNAAIDELIAQKPHYALRPQGNIGQGVKSDAPVSLVSQLKKLV